MPRSYTTTNPGDVRHRTRFIGMWIPGDERPFAEQAADPAGAPAPIIRVLEQTMVRLADREKVLEDLGELAGTTFNQSESFQVRNPQTDAEIPGQTATVAQALALIYSWVRHKQALRDVAMEIAETARLALADADNGAAAIPVETTTATTTTVPEGAMP